MASFNILRAAAAELYVTDLERSRHFYVDVLGFVETEKTKEALYLRGVEEFLHHSLVLRKGPRPALGAISFRLASADELPKAEAFFREKGLPFRWQEGDGVKGDSLLTVDPMGFPVEYFFEMAHVASELREFHHHRGGAPMRLDHFNLQVPDVEEAYRWYRQALGFRLSEYTETDDRPPRLWAAWLFRKPNVHDVALMQGPKTRLHHVGFWVPEPSRILAACDILAAAGHHHAIERGPGRHGISNAFFLYLRDPDGHRIEFYTGDYSTLDPDLPPRGWKLHDPRRQTYWGAPAPQSWFEEGTDILES
ncbi:MAG: 3,4-dihydroxyphenylacetate 2,3-dioxygenase [Clostridiales bacterium]|nr:3,4-dihydroxyphenylacetate 2,3-dioxygenase [Clostridiales bacterium]